MPNGIITEGLTLQTDVSLISLRVGEKICKHPDDTTTPVEWTVTGRRTDENNKPVVDYRTPDGTEDSHTFTSLSQMVWVDLGPVNK